jgi:hypothetical protein
VFLNFTLPPYLPVDIEWIKECGIVLDNFQGGSYLGGDDVISGGRVKPVWRMVIEYK